jgi:hypothetical protein
MIKKQDTIKNPLALAALAMPTRIAFSTSAPVHF